MSDEIDWFAEGYDAFVAGAGIEKNPCAEGTKAETDWNDGWLAAEGELSE